MNKEEITLKERIKDLEYAIIQTQICFDNCDTPSIKDLYLQGIVYYKEELILARSILEGLK